MTLHMELKAGIEDKYASQLSGDVQLTQDAILVSFDSGLSTEIRYLNADEYSINWSWGDAALRIDTAPLHKHISTFPNHLHDANGQIQPDPLTLHGSNPLDNVERVLDRLLTDPLLESGSIGGETHG